MSSTLEASWVATMWLWILAIGNTLVYAHTASYTSHGPRPRIHGLIGFGIPMYEPPCAYACQKVFASVPLQCSDFGHTNQRRHGGHYANFTTTSECFAKSEPYLQSVAWCIDEYCHAKADHEHGGNGGHGQDGEASDPPLWQLEEFWEVNVVSGGGSEHVPKLSYAAALNKCGDVAPEKFLSREIIMVDPAVCRPEDFQAQYNQLVDFARVEKSHTKISIFIMLLTIVAPVVLNLIDSIMMATLPSFSRLLHAYCIDPALFGRQHKVPLPYSIGILPTRGQALLIGAFLLINAMVSAVSYQDHWPNAGYTSPSEAARTYVSNRLGVLAFANLPALFLYSTRNNPLINITNWSRGDFILLHRWIAYTVIVQAALHVLIKVYNHMGTLVIHLSKPYWIVGTIAIVVFCAIIPCSLLPVRKRFYELFLNVHILFAIISLLGCYYHVYLEFGHKWGYENWVYLAAGIWIIERIARGFRILIHGVPKATAVPVDYQYCELTVPGAKATGHVYLYLLGGGLRLMQNHPFSVAGGLVPTSREKWQKVAQEGDDAQCEMFEIGSDSDSEETAGTGVENHEEKPASRLSSSTEDELPLLTPTGYAPAQSGAGESLLHSERHPTSGASNDVIHQSTDQQPDSWLYQHPTTDMTPGISLIITRCRGITALLCDAIGSQRVLIEGPYRSPVSSLNLIASTAHLVCIVGGSGISAILPLLHARASPGLGKTSLYWSTRSKALAGAIKLGTLRPAVDIHVKVGVGQRWVAEDVLDKESVHAYDGDMTVVSCGPPGLADDVRWAVVRTNRRKRPGTVTLVEECFSW